MTGLSLSDEDDTATVLAATGTGTSGSTTGSGKSSTSQKTSSSSSTGCHLTREDIPNIVHSVVCSLAYLIYGAGASSLGASIPSLAQEYHYDSAQMSIVFTSRGVGYVMGTCAAAYILNLPHLTMSKELLTCLFLTGSGTMMFFIGIIHQFLLMNFFFLCQGFCFGAIEATANCALPSMWGKRVQPWIQAMFACYGIGSMVGPVMVGATSYHMAYIIVAFFSLLPVTLLLYYDYMRQKGYSRTLVRLFLYCVESSNRRNNHTRVTSEDEYENKSHEMKDVSNSSHFHHDVIIDDEENIIDEDDTEEETMKQEDAKPAPMYLTAILACFMFFYVGIEVGFSGWITAYAIDQNITHSTAEAAYLSSMFWSAMTCGRTMAVVIAIYVPASIMIRVLLCFALLSTSLAVTIMTISYAMTAFVSALLGLAMSALFPLMITIMVDYGFKIDANTSSMLIVGGTLGQSILPAFIGFVIGWTSPFAMPVIVFISCIMLCILYFTVNQLRLGIISTSMHSRLDSSEHSSHPLRASTSYDDQEDEREGSSNNPLHNNDPHIKEDDLELVTIDFHSI